MATRKKTAAKKGDANRDPITGEPGAHPAGTGIGAAAGGLAGGAVAGAATAATAAAGGAAAGSVVGPVGTIAGAVIGGVAGGLVGKAVAERIDPTVEDAYWREHYASRPYVEKGAAYEDYRPAYRYGWESHDKHQGGTWDNIESKMKSGWNKSRGESKLTWDRARGAVRDAYDRTLHRHDRPADAGAVTVREDLVAERETVRVPVAREDVGGRGATPGRATGRAHQGEAINVPVKEERVHVTKSGGASSRTRGKR
jgi:hypothetical protein